MDKWSSDRTSEGFYLYLWNDASNSIVPEDIYLKVEFNHAGYGRTIPMMAPFVEQNGVSDGRFKTVNEIKDDWINYGDESKDNGLGYGIKEYLKYSYIHLKYQYDKETDRHIYFLDPDYYGFCDSDVLNINLFEARISF